MKLQLKICGMRDMKNIQGIAALKPDYLGFIFYDKSPRDAGNSKENILNADLPESIEKVGVYVNESFDVIREDVLHLGLSMVQLHGNEDPSLCRKLRDTGVKVMKVFSIGEEFDFDTLDAYKKDVDLFLFDTKGKYPGGTGIPFDWKIINSYPFEVPFFISGGVDIENIENIAHIKNIWLAGIDVNSRLESSPGFKDPVLVKKFKEKFDILNDRSE